MNRKGLCTVSFLKKLERGTRKEESEEEEALQKREMRESEVSSELLRWQGIFELHVRHVVVQRHGDDLLHGADQAVLFAAVLDHQGVGLVGVKHDVVGGHDQHAAHHSLQPCNLR